jgi:ribonuclease BN (tRNA processing enzyme)
MIALFPVATMRVKFLGSGDAFGSGGRLNTCFLVNRGDASFLIDCGATAMVSIRKYEVDPNSIGTILLSHLHADHFGGLPSFILDAQLVSRRSRTLHIVGPQGLQARLEALMEAHFPGSSVVQRKFAIQLQELVPEVRTQVGLSGVNVTGFVVNHPSGSPSLALRVDCDGKVLTYTGDTEWVEGLIGAGRHADVLIAECYTYERKVPFHLNYATLREKLPLIGARRLILTHMSPDMLMRCGELQDHEAASDGLEVVVT